MKIVLLTILLSLQFVQITRAADWEREKRMADQIIDAIFDGDPVMLQADGRDFLSIYTEADEAIPRIQAAIDYLKQQGNEQIVLIAHSCSVHMSMHYLDRHGDEQIDGFVGIGMGATDYKQPMASPFPLHKLTIPVLDIFGADDYPAVHRLAPGRWSKMQEAGNPASKQTIVEGANHYFTDRGDELLENVGSWLEKSYQ